MTSENRKPSHQALVVTNPDRPRNAKPWFEKVGAAWPTQDGKGFFVKLFSIPVNGEFVLKEPLEDDDRQEDGDRRDSRGR